MIPSFCQSARSPAASRPLLAFPSTCSSVLGRRCKCRSAVDTHRPRGLLLGAGPAATGFNCCAGALCLCAQATAVSIRFPCLVSRQKLCPGNPPLWLFLPRLPSFARLLASTTIFGCSVDPSLDAATASVQQSFSTLRSSVPSCSFELTILSSSVPLWPVCGWCLLSGHL